MSQLTSLFATHVRTAPAPAAPDAAPNPATSFECACDHCGRVTVWVYVLTDARMQVYKCASCGEYKGWRAGR